MTKLSVRGWKGKLSCGLETGLVLFNRNWSSFLAQYNLYRPGSKVSYSCNAEVCNWVIDEYKSFLLSIAKLFNLVHWAVADAWKNPTGKLCMHVTEAGSGRETGTGRMCFFQNDQRFWASLIGFHLLLSSVLKRGVHITARILSVGYFLCISPPLFHQIAAQDSLLMWQLK